MASPGVDTRIQTLLTVLHDDIEHLQTALRHLDQLRSLLVKRDDTGLQKLLTDLSSEAEVHSAREQERQNLRREIACELRCDWKQVTLSRLAQSVSEPRRAEILDCQKQLQSLTAQLKREHLQTNLLIADCARFNRALIHAFLGQGDRGNACYGATGAVARPANAALMNLHF